MKKNLIFLLIFIFLFIFFIFEYQKSSFIKNKIKEPIIKKDITKLINKIEKNINKKEEKIIIKDKILKRNPIKTFDDFFLPIDINEANKIFKQKDNVDYISVFQINMGSFHKLNIGDIFLLPEINGEIHEIQILNKKQSTIGNSISLSGILDNNLITDNNNIILIVEGSRTAFISVFINGKEYESQIKDGIGYFYRSSDLKTIEQKKGTTDIVNLKNKEVRL